MSIDNDMVGVIYNPNESDPRKMFEVRFFHYTMVGDCAIRNMDKTSELISNDLFIYINSFDNLDKIVDVNPTIAISDLAKYFAMAELQKNALKKKRKNERKRKKKVMRANQIEALSEYFFKKGNSNDQEKEQE